MENKNNSLVVENIVLSSRRDWLEVVAKIILFLHINKKMLRKCAENLFICKR